MPTFRRIKGIVKLLSFLTILGLMLAGNSQTSFAQYASDKSNENIINQVAPDESDDFDPLAYAIFDDQALLDGYTEKFTNEPKEIILAMIQDDTLNNYKMAAAVRVFKEQYSSEVFSREKKLIEKILLRRLNRTDSNFVKVEIMHTLCTMDRYKYFKSMTPMLIQKLDHYNKAVNALAYKSLNDIIETGHNRAREARIVFSILRKKLFLMRRRLAKIQTPDEKLKQKLKLLRWSIKILGNEELKRLPKEVIPLL